MDMYDILTLLVIAATLSGIAYFTIMAALAGGIKQNERALSWRILATFVAGNALMFVIQALR